MTDPTTIPTADDAAFDTSTAAGRLRILWGATADPQLAMSDDEVADVATVLDEHAAMAAELKRLREKINDSCLWCVYDSPKPLMCHCETACGFGNCLWDVRTREGRLAAVRQLNAETDIGLVGAAPVELEV